MLNKFFTYSDPKLSDNKLILPLEPNFFWSRLYEYEFCKQFINSNDIVLDAGCGGDSLFKFLLSGLCKETHGCDLESMTWEDISKSIEYRYKPHIESLSIIKTLYDNLYLKQCSMDSTPYYSRTFDKIFCISVFEHMDEDTQISSLIEFKRVLKDNGMIILTCDYPTINPTKLMKMANRIGLKIDDGYNYTIPHDHIQSDYFGYNCKCFSMVLTKGEIL